MFATIFYSLIIKSKIEEKFYKSFKIAIYIPLHLLIMSYRQKLDTTSDQADQNLKNQAGFGVDGKFQWPIRIFTPILFTCSLLINYFMGIKRNKEVSDKFSLYTTPAEYFFAIWAVIFTGLILANIYNLIKNVWSLKTHIYFGITNALNIIWTIVFDIGSTPGVVVASFLLIAMTFFIFMTWVEMGNIPENQINFMTYALRNILAFQLGWCIAASNLNFGMDIVYWWKASKQTQLIVFWIMTPLCAIILFSYIAFKYGRFGVTSCFCIWLSVGWAFIGAAISSNKCLNGDC